MRMPRLFTRRPDLATLLGASLTAATIAAVATLTYPAALVPAEPRPAAPVTATVDSHAGTTDTDLVDAFNGGWKAGVAALGNGTKVTTPPVVSDGNDPGTVAWVDGWVDGQADALGDDDRDGVVDEDETGWDCTTMGNRQCGAAALPAECRGAGEATTLCVTVVGRPAYGWTNPDGSKVDLPAGAAMIRDLDEKPGTPAFADALRVLDAEYRAHTSRA